MPCNCQGGCDMDCPCLEKSQFCKKFCACDSSCDHFYPGCICNGSCKYKSCPCFAAGKLRFCILQIFCLHQLTTKWFSPYAWLFQPDPNHLGITAFLPPVALPSSHMGDPFLCLDRVCLLIASRQEVKTCCCLQLGCYIGSD